MSIPIAFAKLVIWFEDVHIKVSDGSGFHSKALPKKGTGSTVPKRIELVFVMLAFLLRLSPFSVTFKT
jgi:hypothetical protein